MTVSGKRKVAMTGNRNAERTWDLRWTAARCFRCDRDLTAGPVWRMRDDVPRGERDQRIGYKAVLPFCEACARDDWRMRNPYYSRAPAAAAPCVVCGRMVVQTEPRARHHACSEQCAVAARAAIRRERAAQRRQRHCQRCGAVFTATRSHAEYCSAACRQVAYRTRKTQAAREKAAELQEAAAMIRAYDDALYGC